MRRSAIKKSAIGFVRTVLGPVALFRHAGRHATWHLRWAMVLAALATGADVISLALMQEGMTRVVGNHATDLTGSYPILGGFLAAALVASALRLLAARRTIRAQHDLELALSARAFATLQQQSYEDYLQNGASQGFAAFDQLMLVAYNVLAPFMTLVMTGLSVLVLCIAVAALHPMIGVLLIVGFGIVTAEVTWRSRRGSDAAIAPVSRSRARVLYEARNSFRDIFMANGQARMCEVFAEANDALHKQQAMTQRLVQSSRYYMEMVAFVGALLLLGVIAVTPSVWRGDLPTLGILALAGFRLLPQASAIRSSITMIGLHGALSREVSDLLSRPAAATPLGIDTITLREQIALRSVTVQRAGRAVTLAGLDLVIRKGARIGISGASGAGKSTLLDLICGAIEPQCGDVMIDGERLGPFNGAAWRERIGLVSQHAILLGATVREAVVFPQSPDQVDEALFAIAIAQSGVAAMASGFEDGLDTPIGEAVRLLSGGQRQRLALAHALYRARDLLLLDEATGQLDAAGEQAIVDAVAGLPRNLTIVIVSHRPAPLASCDQVYRLINGFLVDAGDVAAVQAGLQV